MARPAASEDIDALARELPEVARSTSWGNLPSYQVRGKNFIIFRNPRPDALDAETGERLTDVIVFRCSAADKEALVFDDSSPFFTTAHFNGYNAILLRQAHIGQLSVDELREVITDAWLAVAPKRLVKEFLA